VAPLLGAAVAGAVAFVIFEPRMTVLELDDDDLDEEESPHAADEADPGATGTTGTSQGPGTARY
jgi:hypothetical protein